MSYVRCAGDTRNEESAVESAEEYVIKLNEELERRLAVPLQPGEFSMESPIKPLSFDVQDAGCQADLGPGMDPLPLNDPEPPSLFREELRSLLNRHSAENDSNTPDFLLAEYLIDVLDAFNSLNNKRERWYGRKVF